LDSLGFAWILSSETRLINGLCWVNRAKIFLALFPLFDAARQAPPVLACGRTELFIEQA
jgi:hypothetical protein